MQIEMTQDLRDLLRLQRKVVARVTQRGAALAAGQMSEVWWQQIESGRQEAVLADTLATMFYAVSTTPAQLRSLGQDELAGLMERRQDLLAPEPQGQDDAENEVEQYLLLTPRLTDYERGVLVTVAMGLLRTDAGSDRVNIAR